MIRDLTMIGSVLLSVVSLAFGVYKNIEASNAKNFAYVQAYQVMSTVQQANIAASTKASILNLALGRLSTPPAVLDFSQSSAATPIDQVCTDQVRGQCADLASSLASANTTCTQSKGLGVACSQAQQIKSSIVAASCVACYTQ